MTAEQLTAAVAVVSISIGAIAILVATLDIIIKLFKKWKSR